MNNLLWVVIVGFVLTVWGVSSIDSAIRKLHATVGQLLNELMETHQELSSLKSDSFASKTLTRLGDIETQLHNRNCD